MGRSIESQSAFAAAYWDSLRADTTQFVRLPGANDGNGGVPPPEANTRQLGGAPLSVFDRTPHAAEFREQYEAAPHTILLVGATALLAIVETKREPGDEESPAEHAVVPIAQEGLLEPLGVLSADKPGLELGRIDLNLAYGLDDMGDEQVSRRHAVLEFDDEENEVTVTDNFSEHGTKLAQEFHDGDELPDGPSGDGTEILHTQITAYLADRALVAAP
jgi:hypothetical protein